MAEPSDPVPATRSRPAPMSDAMVPGRMQDQGLALEIRPDPSRTRIAVPGLVLASAAVLAACGSGDPGSDAPGAAPGPGPTAGAAPAPAPSASSGASPVPAPGATPAPGPSPAPIALPLTLPPFDLKAASRLLAQASFGADAAEIRRTQAIGLDGWLDEQFAMPRGQSHVDWMVGRGYNVGTFVNSRAEASHTIWRAFITRPDQLRQRMTYALSQIFVISASTISGPCPSIGAGHYMDVLETHAFGQFRDLLEAVTLSPAMGGYLSMRGSQKANPATGRQPDENFAREVMQLFTIGLTTLEPDGTPRLANGAPIETYGPADVSGLARALTGWDFVSGPGIDPATEIRAITPMQPVASRHETGEKRFLGTVVPAGTGARETLSIALDTLVAHPNVGPFIGRQLIQRLVCSNPSPDYVQRVAAVFADNGARVRGDLKAVLRAILTDPEARWPDTRAAGAKLTEPVLRFTQWARAFGVNSPSGAWALGDTSDAATRLGQSPLRSVSVFNFYRPGHVPPNTALASAGLVAPEMQITSETSVAGYLNFMQTAIGSSTGFLGSDLRPDYASLLPLADDPNALVDALNLTLAAGRLGDAAQRTIRDAVTAMTTGTDTHRLQRVRAAVLLTMACPDYMVLK